MKKTRFVTRKKRHDRIRKKVFGTAERPRICVFRSTKHIYVQAVDDLKGHTIAAACSLHTELPQVETESAGKTKTALAVRQLMANRLKAQGIERAVFDRGGYLYHGRVAALAKGVREGGITI